VGLSIANEEFGELLIILMVLLESFELIVILFEFQILFVVKLVEDVLILLYRIYLLEDGSVVLQVKVYNGLSKFKPLVELVVVFVVVKLCFVVEYVESGENVVAVDVFEICIDHKSDPILHLVKSVQIENVQVVQNAAQNPYVGVEREVKQFVGLIPGLETAVAQDLTLVGLENHVETQVFNVAFCAPQLLRSKSLGNKLHS